PAGGRRVFSVGKMSQHEIRPFRFFLAGLLILGPVLAALVVLAALGQVSVPALLALALLAITATATLLWIAHRDSLQLAAHIERLAARVGAEPAVVTPPPGRSDVATALLASLGRLQQDWARTYEAQGQALAGKDAVLEALHDP